MKKCNQCQYLSTPENFHKTVLSLFLDHGNFHSDMRTRKYQNKKEINKLIYDISE